MGPSGCTSFTRCTTSILLRWLCARATAIRWKSSGECASFRAWTYSPGIARIHVLLLRYLCGAWNAVPPLWIQVLVAFHRPPTRIPRFPSRGLDLELRECWAAGLVARHGLGLERA